LISVLFLIFIPVAMVGSRRYRLTRTSWRGIRFSFRGRAWTFIPIFLKGYFLSGLTFGLYYPFYLTRRQSFMMSNSYFGNERFGFYETVCGGAGAGPGFHGASAVHTHMTNTRITDPEVLEHRYPVRLERFAIRAGSGGAGRYRGGDGAVRELTFLAPMSLSLLTQHRVEAPYGMEGGEPGRRGRQRLVRASGETEDLASLDAREVATGDRLILETPGGGGWGRFT